MHTHHLGLLQLACINCYKQDNIYGCIGVGVVLIVQEQADAHLQNDTT